jgi:hypothetical protein
MVPGLIAAEKNGFHLSVIGSDGGTVRRTAPEDDFDFLIATPVAHSAVEAARVQPPTPDPPAHDAFTRLLARLEPDADTHWDETRTQVRRDEGSLVIDDSTLDKPDARAIELVTRHGSGKHHAVVRGINLATLLWTDGDRLLPCDYRLDVSDRPRGRANLSHPTSNPAPGVSNCGIPIAIKFRTKDPVAAEAEHRAPRSTRRTRIARDSAPRTNRVSSSVVAGEKATNSSCRCWIWFPA